MTYPTLFSRIGSMNKKITSALIALTLLIPATANANIKSQTVSKPTLAILDTSIDTSLPIFKDKIIYEVCILEWTTCPNGKSFMEGPGSATLKPDMYFKSGFDHGTQMASVAVQSNPNMNIVFVRIIGQNINGDRQISYEDTIVNALKWVLDNKDKFNIQAISMSQGHHNLMLFKDYCPITPRTKTLVQSLSSANIPAFFAAGNNRDYTRIDWPACIPESISIGAGTRSGIELYSNRDDLLLDFYANGSMRVSLPGGTTKNAAGTSVATQVAAAQWIALKQVKAGSLADTYSLLSRTSTTIKAKTNIGKLINLQGALNG